MKKNGYEEKSTQKQRLLKALETGKEICQIDLQYYMRLREGGLWNIKSNFIDALAELGIANLPARIYGLKKDGYKITTRDVKIKGRFGDTHFTVYSLDTVF
jgi:hypothetical protein